MQQTITNTSLTRLASTVFNFLIAMGISRYLGPKIKGDATIILTTISFIVFFCSVIGGQSLVYLMPRFNAAKLVWPSYLWAFVVCTASFLVMSFFHLFTYKRCFNISLLSLLFSGVNIHASVLLARQEISKYNWVYALPVLLTLCALVFFLYFGTNNSIYPYLYSLYIAYGITLVISLWFCRHAIEAIDWHHVFHDIDESLKHGSSYQLLELLQLLCFRLYFYLLYHLQGAYDLGLYSVGVSLAEFGWVFARSVSTVHYADFSNENGHAIKVRQTIRYIKFTAVVSGLILFLVAACPISVYGIVFGNKFMYVKYTVKWLLPGVWVYNAALVIQSYYLSRGQYSKLIGAHIVGLFFLVSFCYALIPTYYFSGASLAASFSFFITSAMLLMMFLYDSGSSLKQFRWNREDTAVIRKILRISASA
ncbi:MAG: hypothetical protein U0T84_11620 [Chitinophagales bacterium]